MERDEDRFLNATHCVYLIFMNVFLKMNCYEAWKIKI